METTDGRVVIRDRMFAIRVQIPFGTLEQFKTLFEKTFGAAGRVLQDHEGNMVYHWVWIAVKESVDRQKPVEMLDAFCKQIGATLLHEPAQ